VTPDTLFRTVVLPWLQREEGTRYVEDPVPTRCGITQAAWDGWAARPPEAPPSVRELTWAQPWVATFYHAQYWAAAECEKVAAAPGDWSGPLALATLDMAVNSGVLEGDVLLQGVLDVKQDGVVGPQTLAAVVLATRATLEDVLWLRMDYDRAVVRHYPARLPYLPTWVGRVSRLRQLALGLLRVI